MSEQNRNRLLATVSLLVIGLAIAGIVHRSNRSFRPTFDLGYAAMVGEAVANQAAQMMGNQGEVVLVLFRAEGKASRFEKTKERGFDRQIKALGGLHLLATERIDPSEATIPGSAQTGLPSARYFELLAKYPQADAIVSMAGLPRLTAEDLARLPEKKPKLLAVAGDEILGFRLQALFANQVVHRVLLARAQQSKIFDPQAPVVPAARPATTRELLDNSYQIVTADNVGALPDAAW